MKKRKWRKPRFCCVDSQMTMSVVDWMEFGEPDWWVRLGKGDRGQFKFIRIPAVPGYEDLLVVFDLNDERIEEDKMIYYGCGHRGGVRGQFMAGWPDQSHECHIIPAYEAKIVPFAPKKRKL